MYNFLVKIIQWTTEMGKYRNYRNRNFGQVYRTETENTEPKFSFQNTLILGNVHPFLAKFMMKSHFCSILHKKTHKRLNEKDFELDFFSIFLPTVYFLNLNSAICFGSVFSNLTEPKRTEPKLPKHRNFGIFGSVRSSTDQNQLL